MVLRAYPILLARLLSSFWQINFREKWAEGPKQHNLGQRPR